MILVTYEFDTHWYAFPISRGHFYPNNSRKTPMARPLGRDMGVLRELKIWYIFHIRRCCTVRNIVLYCTAIYRESIVTGIWMLIETGKINCGSEKLDQFLCVRRVSKTYSHFHWPIIEYEYESFLMNNLNNFNDQFLTYHYNKNIVQLINLPRFS